MVEPLYDIEYRLKYQRESIKLVALSASLITEDAETRTIDNKTIDRDAFMLYSKTLSKYDHFVRVCAYIKSALKTKHQINEYVPNTHIAMVFEEVLEYCEYLRDYPSMITSSNNWAGQQRFINMLDDINSKFVEYNPSADEVHRVYQVLREKSDLTRNLMKLGMIEFSDLLMPLRCKRNRKLILNLVRQNKYNFIR